MNNIVSNNTKTIGKRGQLNTVIKWVLIIAGTLIMLYIIIKGAGTIDKLLFG